MQFGHTLDRILKEILLANPAYGSVLMSKYDINDGFYQIDLKVEDMIPKLGVAFPTVRDFPTSSPNELEEQSTRVLYSH